MILARIHLVICIFSPYFLVCAAFACILLESKAVLLNIYLRHSYLGSLCCSNFIGLSPQRCSYLDSNQDCRQYFAIITMNFQLVTLIFAVEIY